jgi:6-phosphogluconolactonase
MTLVYIGTYARQIDVFDLDQTSGALSHVRTVGDVPTPTYLAFSKDQKTLYAVNELEDVGGVSAFGVEPATGQLTFLNRVSSGGAVPAHLSVDPTGRWLLVANYGGGTIAAIAIQQDGALGEAASVVQHVGSGPNPSRQREPHPHMIVTDPKNGFVLVPDLGLDAVLAYQLDRATGRLARQPDAGGRLAPGAGPRHLAFSPDGRHAYVINELDSRLAVFAFDSPSGYLKPSPLQVVSTLPTNFGEPSTTAAVVTAPSGRFIYGSNRGHDSVAAFAVDSVSGRLTPLGQTPCGGRTPRDINLDPSGNFLLAANQDSDSVVTLRVDQQTGGLAPTGHVAQVPKPARILFSR